MTNEDCPSLDFSGLRGIAQRYRHQHLIWDDVGLSQTVLTLMNFFHPISKNLCQALARLLFITFASLGPLSLFGASLAGAQTTIDDSFTLPVVRTDSPRQTLTSFLRLEQELEAAVVAYEKDRDFDNAGRIYLIVGEIRSLMDLSTVPPASRRHIGTRTAGYLMDILGRVDIPNLDNVPDSTAFENGKPARYQIPGTPLEIVRIENGAREGEFLFSGQTVEVAPRFFRGVAKLPLRSKLPITSWETTIARITGPLIPSFIVSAIPASLETPVLDTPIWKIIATVVIAAAALFLWTALYRILARGRSETHIIVLLLRVLSPIAGLAILMALRYFLSFHLVIVGRFSQIVDVTYSIIFYFGMAWICWIAIVAFFEVVLVSPNHSGESLDANMLRLTARILALVGSIFILAYGAQAIGLPVLSLLTGLGIGGLAIALAIRPTLENLIGGFILYIDRPVRVGDFCEFDDRSGTVETIGVRSTQVRTLERTLVSIPNSQFADMQIINWAKCDQMLISYVIGLRYETDADQLRYVLAKIREMFHSHPRIDPETIRVRFAGFGASSLDISVRVYAKTREWNDFYAIKEDVLLRTSDIVKQSGTGFAFPSQTLYLGKDDGLDAELGEKAKQEVASWRRSRRFPFPRFAANQLERLQGTLKYPPVGSPDFNATDEELSDGGEQLSAEPLDQASGEKEQT